MREFHESDEVELPEQEDESEFIDADTLLEFAQDYSNDPYYQELTTAAKLAEKNAGLDAGGKRDAQRAGVWLAQQGLVPDQVISSPAERARVSAEKACKAMGL